MWTAAKKRGMSLEKVSHLLSAAPSKLCGFDDRKGRLCKGMDADLLIWDPEATIKVYVYVTILLSTVGSDADNLFFIDTRTNDSTQKQGIFVI